MKTIPEILHEAAAEYYPGTTFSSEVQKNAAELLEKDTRARAVRALRRAVLQFRPVVSKTPYKSTPASPATPTFSKP